MGSPATKAKLASAALAFGLSAASPAPAAAQEYCVACSAPDAVYRCVIEQAVPTGMTLKFLCAGMLARQGSHDKCAIRGGTVFDCNGPVRRIDARAAAALLGSVPDGQTPQGVAQPPSVPPAAAPANSQPASPSGAKEGVPPVRPQPASPPQTVEDLAKDMTRASGKTLEKAGAAITGTTRKAWDCVASLFKLC